MEFIFVCPEQIKTFKSTNFRIIENRGITTDVSGNKILDAWVELCGACPFCGKKHTYHASKLACPFKTSGIEVSGKQMNKKIKLTTTVSGSG